MILDKKNMYRFPWSKTDNPGGWVEVTDRCDISCQGCYRHQIQGHRELEEIKQDILDTIRLTNCDCITVAGGEPLIYPQIVEVIRFIATLKIKPIIFSNGEKLTKDLLVDLKRAGLAKIHFHIDSLQERPLWTGKSESELNKLRQYFADFLWKNGRIQCGFHITVYRSNLQEIPQVLEWGMKNLKKVQHISFIAYRALPSDETLHFYANGKRIDLNIFQRNIINISEINITIEEMLKIIHKHFPMLYPCAYLNGTAVHETFKFIVAVNIGTDRHFLGNMGKNTIELVQMFYHLFNGRYFAFLRKSKIGLKIFLLMFFDPFIRKAFFRFLHFLIRNPLSLFDAICVQSIHFQQPNEVINGKVNLCDDCVNMMAYKGELINSCRLDEYRIFGEPLTIVKIF